MELSHVARGQAVGRFIGADDGVGRTRDATQLTVFQKIGLVGLAIVVAAAVNAFFILPLHGLLGSNLFVSFLGFVIGGTLLWIGIFGNIILVIYRAGAERERQRLGLPPTNR